jgi:hypothetical protein
MMGIKHLKEKTFRIKFGPKLELYNWLFFDVLLEHFLN